MEGFEKTDREVPPDFSAGSYCNACASHATPFGAGATALEWLNLEYLFALRKSLLKEDGILSTVGHVEQFNFPLHLTGP